MGICTRLAAALIALFLFPLSVLSTERVRVDPYIKAGPGYTAANGSITGYVPTKSNQDLLLEAERKGWLGSGPTKTPVTVKPKVRVPIGGIGGKLKNLVKNNPARIALGVATMAAVEGVGWVMEDGAVVKQQLGDPLFVQSTTPYYWKIFSPPYAEYKTPREACDAYSAYNNSPMTLTQVSASRFTCKKVSNPSFGTNIDLQGSVTCPSGSNYDSAKGACYSPNVIGTAPVTDADLPALDPYLEGQGAEWLKGLLREVCEGSNNPQACFDDLQKQSPPSIGGPSSVTGPSSTTTGTYTRPDGTTGTTSSTTNTRFDITYGDQHYDYSTTTTTTNTKDGQQTSEETTTDAGVPQETPTEEDPPEEQYTFDDSALPEITPFYEQKYPDGLQGVWNDAKADFENSEFVSFMESFVPSFSGTCPSWSMNFAIGALANFGTIPFQSLCYVFDFIKVIILVTAVFTCRAIVFGG